MENKKNMIAWGVAIVIVVGAAMFWAGTVYESKVAASKTALRGGGNGQGQGNGNGGQRRAGGPGANGGAGDFASGQVISKDDKSVTIKTRNGGSQIVYFSGSTTVGKSVQGSSSDLSVGQQVMANGKNNADGSLAAQNIQIRPADQGGPQGPGQ